MCTPMMYISNVFKNTVSARLHQMSYLGMLRVNLCSSIRIVLHLGVQTGQSLYLACTDDNMAIQKDVSSQT